jgi:hypothetical protein
MCALHTLRQFGLMDFKLKIQIEAAQRSEEFNHVLSGSFS